MASPASCLSLAYSLLSPPSPPRCRCGLLLAPRSGPFLCLRWLPVSVDSRSSSKPAPSPSPSAKISLPPPPSPNHGPSSDASFGRRALIFSTTVPYIVPMKTMVSAAIGMDVSIVQDSVRKILSKAKAAGLLRLAFHDAGTFNLGESSGGMNGSIIYELDRPENAGLQKSIKILEKAKSELDDIQAVSWADLIAVAGAEAVSYCGGPAILVKLGRLDARIPDPPERLPQETMDVSTLKNCFREKGFSTKELVALSGAHTLGSKGFGNPYVFDNTYFKILLQRPWASPDGMSSMVGLPSDRVLAEDQECLRWIKIYSEDQIKFFHDFRSVYVKLVNSGALWKTS